MSAKRVACSSGSVLRTPCKRENAATVGSLTKDQNAKLKAVEGFLSRVRDTAKRAFREDKVKLHEQFQIGSGKATNLAAKLQEARIILAACNKEDNASALAAKGWLKDDTAKMGQAIELLDAADNTQESAKTAKTGTTVQRNEDANELFEHLLTIQNAANIQWPESEVANLAIRAEFHLDTFPPRVGANAAKQAAKVKAATPPPSSESSAPRASA
jgi:hypothetical protein